MIPTYVDVDNFRPAEKSNQSVDEVLFIGRLSREKNLPALIKALKGSRELFVAFKEAEPGHRHISHVLGAYPGNQIDLAGDRKMRGAVEKTLQARLEHGGAATGWSRAWTIGMFARLADGEEAYAKALEIRRKIGDRLGEAGALSAWALREAHAGHTDEAREHLR